jgi:hypothetical protein
VLTTLAAEADGWAEVLSAPFCASGAELVADLG